MFDEEPEGDPHGECANEIRELQALVGTIRGLTGCVTRNVSDVSAEIHSQEIAEQFNKLKLQKYEAAAEYLRAEAKKIPLGEGNVQRGFSSTYNALVFCAEALERASAEKRKWVGPSDVDPMERTMPVTEARSGQNCIDCGKPVTSGNICVPCLKVRYPSKKA